MKKRELTDEERELWLEIATGKTPAAGKKKAEPAAHTKPKNKVPAAQPIEFGNPAGIDKKRIMHAAGATLDLHGLTQDKAHPLVVSFIKRAAASGHKTVLIITGKGRQGGGVLRASLPGWLDIPQLRPFILAITYATPKEGGEGAIRVLLKRAKAR